MGMLKLRQGEVEKGEHIEVVKIKNSTFKELPVEYLLYCETQKNQRNTKIMINNFNLDFGNVPLKNFSTLMLEKYQAKLLSTLRKPLIGTTELRAPISTATVDRRMAAIKGMFTKAVDWKMVSKSVSDEVHKAKMFRGNKRKDRFLSTEEIAELLAACGSNVFSITGKPIEQKQAHLKPFIIFGLTTGCRKEEILSLKGEDVDLKHGFINILETKNGDSRQVPINETLVLTLKSIPRNREVPYVFFDPDTKKRFSNVSRSFGTACRKAGIRGVTPHTLRHTFASQLVMTGTDLTTVSRLLGHKSLTMTLRYAHLAPNHLDKAVNTLNSVMGIIKKDPSDEISTKQAQSR